MHGAEKRIVCILRSDSDPSRHYVGITNDVRARLEWHNHGPCGHTVNHRPWSLVVSMQFRTEKAAVRFEKYLKSGSGRAFTNRHFGDEAADFRVSKRDCADGHQAQRRDGNSGGAAERLTRTERGEQHAPESWSPDGRTLTFRAGITQSIFTLTIGDAAPKRFDDSITAHHFGSSFSPDGRWLAYSSFEGQRAGTGARVFVQPFPRTGAKYQVSSTSGDSAQWSSDGKQILYNDGPSTGRLMMLDVRTTGGVSVGTPTPISTPDIDKPPTTWRPYDLLPDGKRILIVQSPADAPAAAPRQINVVLNWLEELKRRVPSS